MHVFPPHLAILPPEQQGVWPHLAPLQALGFVLYGGTAIALRLGHRLSIDFDFFNDQPLNQKLLLQYLPLLTAAQTIQDGPNTWTVQVVSPNTPPGSGGRFVKISFFGGIDVGRLGEPETTSDGVLAVASPEDLLAHKLKVMLQRIEAKDYRDVAAFLRSGIPLELGLGGAVTVTKKCNIPDQQAERMLHALRHPVREAVVTVALHQSRYTTLVYPLLSSGYWTP
jgi:hypothetical protein